jgi:hypothetical protein
MPEPSQVLCERDRVDLRALTDRVGTRTASELLYLARESLARAVAGLPCRRGTISLIEARLEFLRSMGEIPAGEAAE